MTSVYESYTTLTSANALEHSTDAARVATHFRRWLLPPLQREGFDLPQARVLEFGVGWGRNLLALRSLGASDVHGVDISPEQVALAQSLGLEDVALISQNEDLVEHFAGREFDLILAVDVLEHLSLQQIEQFAACVNRLLSPGGLLLIQVPNDLAPLNPVRYGDITHLRAFTKASVRQFFTLAGMQTRYITGVPFPGTGLVHALRSLCSATLVNPVARFISLLLYGRNGEFAVEPNLLALGKREHLT